MRRVAAGSVCISTFCATAAFAQTAQLPTTEPPTATLSWVRLPGATDCPSTQAIASLVETQLGRRVWVSASAADVAVEVSVTRSDDDDGFDAMIRIADSDGVELGLREVHVTGESCDVLAEPVALVIAVAIDPGRQVVEAPAPVDEATDPIQEILDASGPVSSPGPEPSPREPSPTAVAARRSEPTRDAPSRTTARASPTGRPSLRIGVGGAAAFGRLPGPAFGITVGLRDAPAGWPLLIEGWFFVPDTVDASGSGAVRFVRGELALYACPLRPTWDWGAAWFCGGAHFSLVAVEPEGFRRNESHVRFELDPSLTVRLGIELGPRFAIGLGLTGSTPIPQHTYDFVDDAGERRELYATPPVRALVTVELLVRPR